MDATVSARSTRSPLLRDGVGRPNQCIESGRTKALWAPQSGDTTAIMSPPKHHYQCLLPGSSCEGIEGWDESTGAT